MKKFIFIISGATATGKTKTSIELAEFLKENNYLSEIVNFDSLLFYQELNIGTAKPTQEEKKEIPHSLIDIRSIQNPLNAADFYSLAMERINYLHKNNIIPILTGGSAFYLRSIIKGMYDSPTVSKKIQDEVSALYQDEGIDKIRKLLYEVDLESYNNLHENDHYRNIRAYEHYLSTGSPFSEEKRKMEENDPYDFSKAQNSNWLIHHIYLSLEKERHWEIMKERAYEMIQSGLIIEVEELLKKGFTGLEKPLGSIGYKETLAFLKGEIKTKDDLLEKIFIATRRLAKSQKTFFNKITPKLTYSPLIDNNKILENSKAFLESFC